jgi:hypothetical protein
VYHEYGILLWINRVYLDFSVYGILKINLGGQQWLFSAPVKTDAVPAICLRHDVDGCVWQLESPQENGHWPCTHIGTFPAFGYVLASKQQKKFCTCAPGTWSFFFFYFHILCVSSSNQTSLQLQSY